MALAQRENLALDATETQILLGSLSYSSSPAVDPWALSENLLPFVFTFCPKVVEEMNHSCL